MGRVEDAAALLGMRPAAAAAAPVTSGWLRGLVPADVNRAFRAAALAAHPDKPDGDADKFRRATEARDVMLKAVASAKASVTPSPSASAVSSSRHASYVDPSVQPSATGAPRRAAPMRAATTTTTSGGAGTPQPPPPFAVLPAVPFSARLPNGTLYAFDASPAAFGSSGLKHGDVVRRVDASGVAAAPAAAVGVVIGVASTGTAYWWRRGGGQEDRRNGKAAAASCVATVFGKLSGPKAPTWHKVSGTTTPAMPACPSAARPSSGQGGGGTTSAESSAAPTPPPPAAAPLTRAAASGPSSAAATTDAAGAAAAGAGGGVAGIAALQRKEAEVRTLFASRVEAFYAQAAWVLHLPGFAAADRSYNAAFVAA